MNIRSTSKASKIYLGLAAAIFVGLSFGQGLPMGGAGISAADLAAIRGGGLGGVGLSGGVNTQNLLSIPTSLTDMAEENDPKFDVEKTGKQARAPVVQNEFQKYILQTTGQSLPLFGSDFFESQNNNALQLNRAPIADDYTLGPGDQLLIRIWGTTNAEIKTTVDRQGQISIPKVGTLSLAGTKGGELDAVVKSFLNRYYKDVQVSVSLAKLRKVTVYVVGQARNPGSYALSSQSTLTSALFASGGASAGGSLRSVQLKRRGQVVADFDLYAFLSRGDKSADVKLQDGDVLFYPAAVGFMALVGKVNSPAVYEVRRDQETVADFLALAGGLTATADPRSATIERLQPDVDQPRSIQDISLDSKGLTQLVKGGDVITVQQILPSLGNAITLRGSVSQPRRMAWREGMHISDVIKSRASLMTTDSIRKQNEVLFDGFEQERAARHRARVPNDLAAERILTEKAQGEDKGDGWRTGMPTLGLPLPATKLEADAAKTKEATKTNESPERALEIAKLGKPILSEETIVDKIGALIDQVNMDYAVIERISRDDLKVSVIPFNLGKVLAAPKGVDDLLLQAGDVITVFSAKDIRVPASRRQVFVRIEGEVNNPGVYPVMPGENLRSILEKAGGITNEAYLFATGFYREDVKKSQQQNLEKLLRKLEAESSSSVSQVSQSIGASADAISMQAKIQSIQQAQRQSLERFRSIRPEGRIALGMPNKVNLYTEDMPKLRLENGDRIHIPPKPDFVHILGSVNTESALIYKQGDTVGDYLKAAGTSTSSDLNAVILVRADGSAKTNQGSLFNDVLSTTVLPGDTIVMPERFDRESSWSVFVRNAKDWTQILYQMGLGAAAIKTLRQ